MLTLNVLGKHGGELVKFLRDSLKDNENELKILIEGPMQVEEIRKCLEPLDFSNFVPEDDDGNLFLLTSKEADESDFMATPLELSQALNPAPLKAAPPLPAQPTVTLTAASPVNVSKPKIANLSLQLKNATGVLISREFNLNGKYKKIFLQKILSSLVNSKIKPEVLGLMNGAVSLAAYNSKTCEYLKELEAAGVKILISQSCADYLGITESIGAGTAVDMSEIFEEIFSCERILNL